MILSIKIFMVRKRKTFVDFLCPLCASLLCIWNQTYGDIMFFPGLRASESGGPPSGVPAWGWGLALKAPFRSHQLGLPLQKLSLLLSFASH